MKEKRIMLLFSPQAQVLETCHTTYILFPGAKSYHIWTPVLLYVYSYSHERFRSNYLLFVFLSALEELLKNFAGRYATGDEVSFVCFLNFVFFSFLRKKGDLFHYKIRNPLNTFWNPETSFQNQKNLLLSRSKELGTASLSYLVFIDGLWSFTFWRF